MLNLMHDLYSIYEQVLENLTVQEWKYISQLRTELHLIF